MTAVAAGIETDAPHGPAGGPGFIVERVPPRRLALERFGLEQGVLDYSVRRYFVDEFFTRHFERLARERPGATIIDIGGHKHRKRGRFDAGRYPMPVRYANLDARWEPDFLCDASAVPAAEGSFDVVVLGEVIEHLPAPEAALREACRLLAPGGELLATAPFMFRVHPDPIDVGRYAPDWWARALERAGFASAQIEPQGAVASVAAEIARAWAKDTIDRGSAGRWAGVLRAGVRRFRAWAGRVERRGGWESDGFRGSFTTGFGVRALKGGAEDAP